MNFFTNIHSCLKVSNMIGLLKNIRKIFGQSLEVTKPETQPNISEVIEIERHKADMFKKKTDTWLKILGKESIASILGAILLLVLTICILVNMFLDKEPIKIVETAFLLILGYFFGQSVSRNMNNP